ncbi:MAG: lipocalin family protein [Oxalicibacterium faecigallinarum]|uniref:Outer membrane lipoprotein Blc n=1 Tax=Oxalicibacterium faecigallinarum TaxID=573741 RepID=A0A8J3F1G1_9BURK|nr:lipocalin family protein [Oxalicibacterium faecigallinarum]MDQ7969347.1 lipocalin family protein [Oxalicibacterium faecigallinarum]GGI19262.1 hypothetical protein GCM10008066_18200 [Oxalicibacterium faecigallinarum]
MKRILVIGAMLAACFSNGVSAQEVRTVPKVDLAKYVGVWYEIARFPNRFQEQCTGNVTAQYRKRSDGDIDVINRCKQKDASTDEAIGRARVADPATNARLKVRFAPDWLGWIPFVWADYWIIDLADDYSYAVVGEPSREYLWVLSRSPVLPDATYDAIVNRATEQGFDTSKLKKTQQDH